MGTTTSTEIWLEWDGQGGSAVRDGGERDGRRDESGEPWGGEWSDVEREWLTSPAYDAPDEEAARALFRRGKRGAGPPRRLVVLSDAPELLFRLEPLPRPGRGTKASARRRRAP